MTRSKTKDAADFIIEAPPKGGGQSYSASRIKRRRRTKAEIENIHAAMIELVQELAPMTLRQLFYALVVRDIVEKTEAEYESVCVQLLKLRRGGLIPWSDISDHTRWVRRPRTHNSMADALKATARLYRRSLWSDAEDRVEVWCEKDALAGIIADVTTEFDVPLYVSRGFSSDSYLYNAAESIKLDSRPLAIYEFGDNDPSGVAARNATERKLREFLGRRQKRVTFMRAAVTPEQIRNWALPSRPTKREGNSHAATFVGDSVELDAIPPDTLRMLVRTCIEFHIDPRQLEVTRAAEESERDLLRQWEKCIRSGMSPPSVPSA
jgi:hypothetical protein